MQLQDIGTKAGYDLWAESYEQTPNPVVAIDARHSMAVLSPAPGERVLDAGCGTGRNLAAMLDAGARPSGVDFSPGMLAVARRRHPGVPLIEADLEDRLPFGDGEFDAVYCALLAEHLAEPGRAVAEFARVLRPGGRLVLSVFHPVLAATGMSAQFERDGAAYRLVAHPHAVADYEGWITQAGLGGLRRHEISGDAEMAAEVPWAVWLVGKPVLLVLEAEKPG